MGDGGIHGGKGKSEICIYQQRGWLGRCNLDVSAGIDLSAAHLSHIIAQPREPVPHLPFGFGRHQCIGHRLRDCVGHI